MKTLALEVAKQLPPILRGTTEDRYQYIYMYIYIYMFCLYQPSRFCGLLWQSLTYMPHYLSCQHAHLRTAVDRCTRGMSYVYWIFTCTKPCNVGVLGSNFSPLLFRYARESRTRASNKKKKHEIQTLASVPALPVPCN